MSATADPTLRRYSPAWILNRVRFRIERARRLRAATKAVAAFPTIPTRAPHGLPAPLIVSLTSFPPRFPTLAKALASLLDQTVQADRTILWIAKDDMIKLPADVLALQASGLEIRACSDTRSFKKIIPCLAAHPDAFIVTADDDLYYEPDWLETFVRAHDPAAPAVLARRVHLATAGSDGHATRYGGWAQDTLVAHADAPGTALFPTGCGGIFYPPGCFADAVLDEAAFLELCPFADDVWLFWMQLLRGTDRRRVGEGSFFLTKWPSSQRFSLMHENVAENRNDSQIKAVEARYGRLGEFVGTAGA